jgi:hypothetical protein
MSWGLSGSLIIVLLLGAFPVVAQGANEAAISSPSPGEIVLGQVAIKGTTNIPSFSSAELDFGYPSDPTNTWFLIKNLTDPIDDNILATWDTTSISDGRYILRLRVRLSDGTFQDVTVPVDVRNYTALPTSTSTATPTGPALQIPTAMIVAPTPSMTATPALAPRTPTPPPANPATVTTGDIYTGFWLSATIVMLLFVGFLVLIRLRRS